MVKALEAFGQVSLILLSFLVLVCSSVSEYYSLHLITDPSFSLDWIRSPRKKKMEEEREMCQNW